MNFCIDPIREYPNSIIIYHLKLNGVSHTSVQIDTKRKLELHYKLEKEKSS